MDAWRAIPKRRGQFRKLKLYLESKIGKRIPADHAMIPWLVQWAGSATLKMHVRNDGRTAYEDMAKHRVKHTVVGFGEHVQF